jgi:dTDP-4-dehydrorhamnose reductase
MTFLLVFGSCGQLGQEVRGLAAAQGVSCPFVPESEADITDPAAVAAQIASHRPSVVVNAAAYTQADDAETHVEEAFRVNETGVAVLARACAESRTPLIHISTDYVFGGTKHGAYREDDPVGPLNVYGQSKFAGEAIYRQQLAYDVLSLDVGFMASTVSIFSRRLCGSRPSAPSCKSSTISMDVQRARPILRNDPNCRARLAGCNHFRHVSLRGPASTWHGFACEIVAAQSGFTVGNRPFERFRRRIMGDLPAGRPIRNSIRRYLRIRSAFGPCLGKR